LDGVELVDSWMNSDATLLRKACGDLSEISRKVFDPKVVDRIKTELAQFDHSVSMLTVHNKYLRITHQDQRDEVDRLRMCMDVAEKFGTNRLNTYLGDTPADLEGVSREDAVKACIDTIWQCVEVVQERGFYLLLENHPGLSADDKGYAAVLSGVDSPHLGANLDCKNTRKAGQDPTEFLEREEIICRLMCLHVDNYLDTPEGWNRSVSVDEGDVNIAAVLRKIKQYGYDGWLSIEYGGLGIKKVGRSAAFIRQVWEET